VLDLLLQRPVALLDTRPAKPEEQFLMRATENATSHGERCREDARVHYEGFNVHACRADHLLAQEAVSVGLRESEA
jgi:hypothetical protein